MLLYITVACLFTMLFGSAGVTVSAGCQELCLLLLLVDAGFDARHNSRVYAELAAAVFASAGVKVRREKVTRLGGPSNPGLGLGL